MVLHPYLNKNGWFNSQKAQFNIGFVIAITLFTFLLLLVVINVLQMVPTVKDRTDTIDLQATAIGLNKLLLDDPGSPKDWTSNPIRVGLAKYNNYSNYTISGELDTSKVAQANSSIAYSVVKNGIGLERQTNFRLLITNGNQVYLDISNFSSIGSLNAVTLQRFVVINKTKYNATLTVWK